MLQLFHWIFWTNLRQLDRENFLLGSLLHLNEWLNTLITLIELFLQLWIDVALQQQNINGKTKQINILQCIFISSSPFFLLIYNEFFMDKKFWMKIFS